MIQACVFLAVIVFTPLGLVAAFVLALALALAFFHQNQREPFSQFQGNLD